jgi:ribosomal protein S6
MKEIYNLVVLLDPSKKELAKEEEIKKLVKDKADYLDDKTIGQQDLAYKIEDLDKAYYFWIDFNGSPDILEKIKKGLAKIEPLRYLLSKKPLEAVKKRKTEEKKTSAAPSAAKASSKKKKAVKSKAKKEQKTASKIKRQTSNKKKESAKDEKKRIEDLDKKLEEIL